MEPIVIAILFGLAVAVVLLTSLIKNTGWNHWAKNLLATVLSVVAAGAAVWFGAGGLEFVVEDLFLSITSLYGLSQLIYNFIISETKPGQALDRKLASLGSDTHAKT